MAKSQREKEYYESKKAKCPFYLHERQQEICCESSIQGAVIHITFPLVSFQRAHQTEYCYTMQYDKCPHYKAVERRYEQEKKNEKEE